MTGPMYTRAIVSPSWMDDAACASVDPELFFPDKGGSIARPRAICMACPVSTECAAYADANDERYGLWGGLSEHDRRKSRRRSS